MGEAAPHLSPHPGKEGAPRPKLELVQPLGSRGIEGALRVEPASGFDLNPFVLFGKHDTRGREQLAPASEETQFIHLARRLALKASEKPDTSKPAKQYRKLQNTKTATNRFKSARAFVNEYQTGTVALMETRAPKTMVASLPELVDQVVGQSDDGLLVGLVQEYDQTFAGFCSTQETATGEPLPPYLRDRYLRMRALLVCAVSPNQVEAAFESRAAAIHAR